MKGRITTASAGKPNFSLTIELTPRAQELQGKQKQYLRDDVTRNQFIKRSINVHDKHPLHLLHLKYLESKGVTAVATFYDNKKPVGSPVVLKILVNKGVETILEDRRDEYFDISTGIAHPETPFSKAMKTEQP